MKIDEIMTKAKNKDQFTIISDDETSVLLFEGKTIMAGQFEDLHSGHEEAYFNKQPIKKNWKSLEHLYQIIIKQFKMEDTLVEFEASEDLFSYLSENDLYTTDDLFYP